MNMKPGEVTLSQKKASSFVDEEYPKAPPKSHIEILRQMRKKSLLVSDLESLERTTSPPVIVTAMTATAAKERIFMSNSGLDIFFKYLNLRCLY